MDSELAAIDDEAVDIYMADRCVTFGCWNTSSERDINFTEGRLKLVFVLESSCLLDGQSG